MPSPPISLYIDTFAHHERSLVTGLRSNSPYIIESLKQGDVVNYAITLFSRTQSYPSPNPFSIIDPAEFSLKIGLYKVSDSSQLAFQNAFADDVPNGRKTGKLALDTAAINTALAAVATLAVRLEIQMENLSAEALTVFSRETTLYKDFITTASITVPPGETAATTQYVNESFIRVGQNEPGFGFTLVSDDGTKARRCSLNNNNVVVWSEVPVL